MKKIMGYIKLSRIITREDGVYSAFNPELDLATCGKSFDEADRRIKKATLMVLNSATKKGEINALLKERNIPFYQKRPDVLDCSVTLQPKQWATSELEKVALLA